MKRDDIIVQAVVYLESSYFLFFALALKHTNGRVSRNQTEEELEYWKKTARVKKYAEDFALDLLSGRVDLFGNRKQLGVGNERKGVEQKATG